MTTKTIKPLNQRFWETFQNRIRLGAVTCCLLLISSLARGAVPEFHIQIKNHLFSPAEIQIPANQKVKLIIHNLDETSEEFESYELNREKIVMPGQASIVFIGPLAPGRYPFFGEFNPKTAQGVVVVAAGAE